jgi:hypothetical protein
MVDNIRLGCISERPDEKLKVVGELAELPFIKPATLHDTYLLEKPGGSYRWIVGMLTVTAIGALPRCNAGPAVKFNLPIHRRLPMSKCGFLTSDGRIGHLSTRNCKSAPKSASPVSDNGEFLERV